MTVDDGSTNSHERKLQSRIYEITTIDQRQMIVRQKEVKKPLC